MLSDGPGDDKSFQGWLHLQSIRRECFVVVKVRETV
jgi:hypothetical protein